MDWLIAASEGFRIFSRSVRVRINGLPKYEGNAEQICEQIVEKCWNKEKQYFMTCYKGSYPEFYARDFGIVVASLIRLGYKERVRMTLEYALKKFKSAGKVTTTITPGGKPFDFPAYAPDSLAFLLYSLAELGDMALVAQYKEFLDSQTGVFFRKVVDKDSGLPRKGHFSSMKDYSVRGQSCYDLCMCYMVQKYAKKLGLNNPLKDYDFRNLLMRHYWRHTYFLDDLSGKRYIAGDANVIPFWTGLVEDKEILSIVIGTLEHHKLDRPFPLRYTREDNTEVDMHWLELFAKDWERHVAWLHLGYMYISIVSITDKKKAESYINEYKDLIEKFGNHLEVFTPEGKPYKSPFYYSSDSMIWAANYLALSRQLK